MKFANFIKEAGLDLDFYPKASELEVTVYDRKGRLMEEDHIHFAEPIFVNNANGLKKFCDLVKLFEEQLTTTNVVTSGPDEVNAIVIPKGLNDVIVILEISALVVRAFNHSYVLPR